ncbi:9493_t:CDS:2 [Entrophospora sp. SA101]|nr:9493_t:CDS:2 [Entrophospora sp. SA101]
MNLVFAEIFKESPIFERISEEAVRIVSFFHKSGYFMGNLRDEQIRIYKKSIKLALPSDTRWNSYYFCFNSVLKTQAALKFLAAKFNPDRVNVTRTNGIPNIPVDRRTTRNNKRRLPDDIVDSINDPVFWSKLFSLQNLLYPLCCFLNQLQKDAARLYEVVHCFAYTLHIFSMHHDLDFSEKMVSRIEKRWKGWEQPILLLSIILHPSYKLSKFRPTINNLSWTHVGQWLKYYYHAFCGKPATSILAELIDYRRGNDPYDYDSFLQFKGNVLNFWESTIGVGPELAKVAIHIHAVCVNSASVERLWSSMGYFILIGETDYQYHNKVLAMSQIRSDILYQQDLFVNENHETNDDDFLENNNESVNSNSDENVNQWNIIVAHWRDEASQENQLENHSDESLLEEDLDNDFLVGVNNIHPADNVNLKWELSSSVESSSTASHLSLVLKISPTVDLLISNNSAIVSCDLDGLSLDPDVPSAFILIKILFSVLFKRS